MPGTVLSALRLLSHLTHPHSKPPNEYYYTNLAHEETKPQKQGHPMHWADLVYGTSTLCACQQPCADVKEPSPPRAKDSRPEQSTAYASALPRCPLGSQTQHVQNQTSDFSLQMHFTHRFPITANSNSILPTNGSGHKSRCHHQHLSPTSCFQSSGGLVGSTFKIYSNPTTPNRQAAISSLLV